MVQNQYGSCEIYQYSMHTILYYNVTIFFFSFKFFLSTLKLQNLIPEQEKRMTKPKICMFFVNLSEKKNNSFSLFIFMFCWHFWEQCFLRLIPKDRMGPATKKFCCPTSKQTESFFFFFWSGVTVTYRRKVFQLFFFFF